MIDEKGRLFGKVNIVDLLIVLVIIAAVAFVGIKYVMPQQEAEPVAEHHELVIYSASSNNFTIDQLKAGNTVWDYSSDTPLGTLKSWSTAPYVEYISEEGTAVPYESDRISSINLVIDVNGTIGEFGITVGGQLYASGHTLVVYTGTSKFWGTIRSFE